MLDEKFYSPRDIADMFGVSSNTIRTLCDKGDLKAIKIGTQYRISETELNNYLKNQNQKGE